MLYFAILPIHIQVWFVLNIYCFTKVTRIMFCLPLSHIVVYCDTDILYCVPYRAVCIAIHRCAGIIPALVQAALVVLVLDCQPRSWWQKLANKQANMTGLQCKKNLKQILTHVHTHTCTHACVRACVRAQAHTHTCK